MATQDRTQLEQQQLESSQRIEGLLTQLNQLLTSQGGNAATTAGTTATGLGAAQAANRRAAGAPAAGSNVAERSQAAARSPSVSAWKGPGGRFAKGAMSSSMLGAWKNGGAAGSLGYAVAAGAKFLAEGYMSAARINSDPTKGIYEKRVEESLSWLGNVPLIGNMLQQNQLTKLENRGTLDAMRAENRARSTVIQLGEAAMAAGAPMSPDEIHRTYSAQYELNQRMQAGVRDVVTGVARAYHFNDQELPDSLYNTGANSPQDRLNQAAATLQKAGQDMTRITQRQMAREGETLNDNLKAGGR